LFIYGVLLNFIDLKDYEGDRRAGIFTLPVLLGLRRAQWLLAVLFVALYPLVPWLAGEPRLLWACVPAGLLAPFWCWPVATVHCMTAWLFSSRWPWWFSTWQ
jgi:4-hydroxybenzoate polyprenyltransferase